MLFLKIVHVEKMYFCVAVERRWGRGDAGADGREPVTLFAGMVR